MQSHLDDHHPTSESPAHSADERRQHHRHHYSTFATLRGDATNHTFWIKDVSMGGALLCGSERLEVGGAYSARLHLPWREAVQLDAKVVRSHPAATAACPTAAFGVAFPRAPRAAWTGILDALLAEQQQAKQRDNVAVMLVSRRTALQESLASDLGRLGLACVVARTPLDLVLWLHHRRVKIGAILVDNALDHQVLFALLGFLAGELPEVRRIIVSDGPVLRRKSGLALQGQASAVLNSPWDRHRLAQTLRISG
jgi:hypothetical protein